MDRPSSGGKRVAFFGGSFDPPHLGHLAVARAARSALSLDSVLFAPVGAQPLKPRGSTASFTDRIAMTELAVAGEPGFTVSLADAPNPSGAPNYTLDTLLKLRAELGPDALLFCLMGADSFRSLKRWHRAAEIPFAAPLIVASRPSQRLNDLKAALPKGLSIQSLPDIAPALMAPDDSQVELRRYLLYNPAGEPAPFYLLPKLNIEISASAIRRQVRAASENRPLANDLLSKPVSEYIRSHRLYL
jgi:nicotinate-nucleotide adenylyltransferase